MLFLTRVFVTIEATPTMTLLSRKKKNVMKTGTPLQGARELA